MIPFNCDWVYEEINNTKMLVVAYLTSCYIYYLKPNKRAICSDDVFDKITRELLKRYDEIDVNDRRLISKEDLRAGTGFSIKEENFPSPVKAIALTMSNKEYTLANGILVKNLDNEEKRNETPTL